ncbi:MAG: ZIP family metal transporter [Lachnospiraceae bacterium]|nr:ZIP family metal transporter [Lachnospiraceae bacterium]MDE6980185.1 ZIP family metal transporter [Lachnospiraceae bacterium]
MFKDIMVGLCVPFLGTMSGSAMVFFMKGQMNCKIEKLLLGFASGVMVAASVWSLLLPSIEMAEEQGQTPWLPASAGFLFGMAFLLLLGRTASCLDLLSGKFKETGHGAKKTAMLVFAVTLHNIPEGMAVGVAFAGAMIDSPRIALAGALALAVGIGIQNFPEGAIISMPLRSQGTSRPKAFFYGVLSGLVEPVSAVFTILLAQLVVPVLPFLLAFAAGAMMYVVVEELIPESQAGEESHGATLGVAAGFAIMMILDVALG